MMIFDDLKKSPETEKSLEMGILLHKDFKKKGLFFSFSNYSWLLQNNRECREARFEEHIGL